MVDWGKTSDKDETERLQRLCDAYDEKFESLESNLNPDAAEWNPSGSFTSRYFFCPYCRTCQVGIQDITQCNCCRTTLGFYNQFDPLTIVYDNTAPYEILAFLDTLGML